MLAFLYDVPIIFFYQGPVFAKGPNIRCIPRRAEPEKVEQCWPLLRMRGCLQHARINPDPPAQTDGSLLAEDLTVGVTSPSGIMDVDFSQVL